MRKGVKYSSSKGAPTGGASEVAANLPVFFICIKGTQLDVYTRGGMTADEISKAQAMGFDVCDADHNVL